LPYSTVAITSRIKRDQFSREGDRERVNLNNAKEKKRLIFKDIFMKTMSYPAVISPAKHSHLYYYSDRLMEQG